MVTASMELQTLNPDRERATDDQILFLVLNTSAFRLRRTAGAAPVASKGSTSRKRRPRSPMR